MLLSDWNGCLFSRKVVLLFWRRTKLKCWWCNHWASSILWNSRSPRITNLYLFNKRITGRNTCCCSTKLEAPCLSSSVQNMGKALFWTRSLTINTLYSFHWVLSNAMTNWLPALNWRAITSQDNRKQYYKYALVLWRGDNPAQKPDRAKIWPTCVKKR